MTNNVLVGVKDIGQRLSEGMRSCFAYHIPHDSQSDR